MPLTSGDPGLHTRKQVVVSDTPARSRSYGKESYSLGGDKVKRKLMYGSLAERLRCGLVGWVWKAPSFLLGLRGG